MPYLWLQLDQNLFQKDAIGANTKTGGINGQATFEQFKNLTDPKKYGYNILSIKDKMGNPMKYIINNTMMRIDLPTPLKSGASTSFSIDWNYLITEYYGRSGYEYFAKDGNVKKASA